MCTEQTTLESRFNEMAENLTNLMSEIAGMRQALAEALKELTRKNTLAERYFEKADAFEELKTKYEEKIKEQSDGKIDIDWSDAEIGEIEIVPE